LLGSGPQIEESNWNRVGYLFGRLVMSSYRKISVLIVLVGILGLFLVPPSGAQTTSNPPADSLSADPATFGQEKESTIPPGATSPTTALTTPTGRGLPYIGEISGNRVNVRSGPAAIYYEVARFNKGALVVVCEEKTGWARIEPSSGCFSWISKKYVKLIATAPPLKPAETKVELPKSDKPKITETPTDADQVSEEKTTEKSIDTLVGTVPATPPVPKPAVKPGKSDLALLVGKETLLGEVTGNNVRVRAGSIRVPPINATEVQTRLSKGATVLVIGQRDDFYKIACPQGAYFWVSLDFVNRVGPVTPQALAKVRGQFGPAHKQPLTPTEREHKEYRDLAKLLKTERYKPLARQDFTVIRTRIKKLLIETKSGSVKAALQAMERQLVKYEMGLDIWKTAQKQDKQLQNTLNKIDNEIELLMAIHQPPEKTMEEIVVKGRLAKSAVFTAPYKNQRFLVLDDNERIIYYAISAKDGLDLSRWIDKNVSMMVGQVEYDAFAKVRILKVSNIVELPAGK